MMQPEVPIAMFGGFFMMLVVIGIASYVYLALTMMLTAQRLKVKNAWLAWIPIANLVLLSKMAKMHWWPVLLLIAFFIPLLNIIAMITLAVFAFIWQWKILERRKLPGWWCLLQLIPIVGWVWRYIMWGILAWGK